MRTAVVRRRSSTGGRTQPLALQRPLSLQSKCFWRRAEVKDVGAGLRRTSRNRVKKVKKDDWQ